MDGWIEQLLPRRFSLAMQSPRVEMLIPLLCTREKKCLSLCHAKKKSDYPFTRKKNAYPLRLPIDQTMCVNIGILLEIINMFISFDVDVIPFTL